MIQTINISLIPSDNKPVINVSQFDNVSRVLRFNVFDDAEMEVPHVFDNTETVLLNIRKNDNNIVVITGVIVSDIDPETQEVTEQYLTFELTEQACACVGSNYGEVSITSGDDEVIGSCNFKLIVERSPLAGGISSQTAIDNLTTQIEQITEELIGDNYYDKQDVDGLISGVESQIPTKTSQLTNDSGFITASDIPTIPTKTSQLTNDSGFITASDIPTIPTKTSQLTNDSGFTTIDDAATVNDKTWSSNKISDELYALLPVGSARGAVASFNTQLAKPLVSCVVDENATKLTKCGKNLFDINYLTATNITINNNEATGTARSFNDAFNRNVGGVSKLKFDSEKTYTLSFKSYTDGNAGTSGSGLLFGFRYTDNTSGVITIPNNVNEPTFYSITSTKPILLIQMLFSTLETNIWHLSEVQFEENTTSTDYEVFNGIDYNLPLTAMPITNNGDNNFFADVGDVSLSYKDTIQHYIDTRVQASSNRSLSMMRTIANQVADERTIDNIEGVSRNENER